MEGSRGPTTHVSTHKGVAWSSRDNVGYLLGSNSALGFTHGNVMQVVACKIVTKRIP